MDDAALILLIVVSGTLSILLVCLILVAIKALRIIGSVQRTVAKAESFIESAEEAGQILKKSAKPVAIARIVASFIESARGSRKTTGRKER